MTFLTPLIVVVHCILQFTFYTYFVLEHFNTKQHAPSASNIHMYIDDV